MEIVDVQFLGKSPDYQAYSSDDIRLISATNILGTFGQPDDYIEYHIYDLNDDLLTSNYNYTSYKTTTDVNSTTGTYNKIILDPQADVKSNGYNRGSVTINYNFYKQVLNTGPGRTFWIKQISPSRTEIKVTRLDQANSDIQNAFNLFNSQLTLTSYFQDFYLNFGEDKEVIGVNAVYVEEDGTGYIIFKLYEPLPREYDLKSEFWVVLKNAESVKYQVTTEVQADPIQDQTALRGPNFNIDVIQRVGQTTPYYNYNSLFSTTVSSSYQQLQSLLDEKALRINVDYSDFSNFIHFSSATERIQNFVYKVRLIEQYSASIAQLSNVNGGTTTNATILSSSKATIQQNIDNIITKFDGYEYYLYYTSASTAWPKSTSTQPYTLYPSTSSIVLDWLGNENTPPSSTGLSILYSASLYDNLNSDGLRYTTPMYIRDDAENQPYLTFLDMIGQHFDNIWIYYKDVTNRFSAENNPNVGISIDLVGDALRSLGIQLYTNSNISDSIYYSLLGINPNGSLLPPTGSELITTYVTSSIESLPALTLEEEIYKRLYHNLPYLLKTKGTERGVRALIACYGIPNSILTVNEFGGYNMFTQPDILGIQDNKIYTGSVEELGDKVLTPYTTIQVYNNNTERNSEDIEIGFSPADSINAHITGTLPNIDIAQLIANPALQYSSSYTPLVDVSNTYFKTNYTSRYNVWDFIRIIKYYNNSLFKMLKDFVPARASLASSIIVKPHMLERNKYARHEPIATTSSLGFDQEGIDMVRISGSDPDEIKYSTAYIGTAMSLSGSVPIQNIYSFEKYTGEFSGSVIQAADNYFDQIEYSYQPYQTILGTQEIKLNAVYQNVTASVKSTRFFDLDYSSNAIVPVNYGLITQSLAAGQAALYDPYAPYAQLQDYNYYLQRSTIPRYDGSKLIGRYYNTYSIDDVSYGGDPVINWNTSKLGLFTQVYTSSFIPGLVNIALAYTADVSGGLGELNQENRNWINIQNTFKAGTTLTIKQFDNRKYSAQQTTDGIKRIYSSGYSYSPLIYFRDCATDPTASFINLQGNSSEYAVSVQHKLRPNALITGSSSNHYQLFQTSSTFLDGGTTPIGPLQTHLVGNLYDNPIQESSAYITGGLATPPSYSVAVPGEYSIEANTAVLVTTPDTPARSMRWVLQIVRREANTGNETILKEVTSDLNIGANSTTTIRVFEYKYTYDPAGGQQVNFFNVVVPQLSFDITLQIDFIRVTGYSDQNCTDVSGVDYAIFNPTFNNGSWSGGLPNLTIQAGNRRRFSVGGRFPVTVTAADPINPFNNTVKYKLTPQIKINNQLVDYNDSIIVNGISIVNATSDTPQLFDAYLNIGSGPINNPAANIFEYNTPIPVGGSYNYGQGGILQNYTDPGAINF